MQNNAEENFLSTLVLERVAISLCWLRQGGRVRLPEAVSAVACGGTDIVATQAGNARCCGQIPEIQGKRGVKLTSGEGKRVAVLIPAAGSARRIAADKNKALLYIGGAPMIRHTVRIFQEHPAIGQICLAVRKSDSAEFEKLFGGAEEGRKIVGLVEGGDHRQESVWLAMEALQDDPPDWVLVHDGARPFCSMDLLERVLAGLRRAPAVVPVIPIHDTVRRIESACSEVLQRESLYRCQTPQGFHWGTLRNAHLKARETGLRGTDDAQLVEVCGEGLEFVEGEVRNLKITTNTDLSVAEWVLENRRWGMAPAGAGSRDLS